MHGIYFISAAIIVGALISDLTWAGDFKEARQRVDEAGNKLPKPGKTIFHRVWLPDSFPLKWYLHSGGVVYKGESGHVPNAQARIALEAGFQKWADVQTANISFQFVDYTETAKAACDLENIVTWSDQDSFQGDRSGSIARGITSFYAGPDMMLNDENRKRVPCSAGESRDGAIEYVDLPKDRYPNDMMLKTGTILDMDLVWNGQEYKFVKELGDVSQMNVLGIQALATHEMGHLLGLTHTSLRTDTDTNGDDTPTMTVKPILKTSSPSLQHQKNMQCLEYDDKAAAGRVNPGLGFYPGGTAPFTTGAIKGHVKTENGDAVEGARLWLYRSEDTSRRPRYETFTATSDDFELGAGEFVFTGIPVGEYYLCIQPWNNKVPEEVEINTPSEGTYNWSVAPQIDKDKRNTGFITECFDDVSMGNTGKPSLKTRLRTQMTPVPVKAGETTMNKLISVMPDSSG